MLKNGDFFKKNGKKAKNIKNMFYNIKKKLQGCKINLTFATIT